MPLGLSGLGGGRRMLVVNDLGEPCAGEPHARFDGRGLETEHLGQGSEEEQPSRKLFGHMASRPTARICDRASPRPYAGLSWWADRFRIGVLSVDCARRV